VVIIQCLIFQDGGLLALGCNIINMGIVPSYLGYFLYKSFAGGSANNLRRYLVAILACIVAIEAGAVLVPIQAAFSGVLVVPFATFLVTMLGVHILVGFIEGLITAAVLGYIQQVRHDIVWESSAGKVGLGKEAVLVTLVVFTVITAAWLSLVASGFPDGLEWSYSERPDQPAFEPMVSNEDPRIAKVDDFQAMYSPLPDYSVRNSKLGSVAEEEADAAAGWRSFAGVAGSGITMLFVWLAARMLRRKEIVKA
jgi:cobalt/nickel transport system permease protein